MTAKSNSPDDDDITAVNLAFSKGFFHDVIVQSRVMCVRNPGRGFSWRVLGTALVRVGSIDQAVAAIDRALMADREDQQALVVRGVALHGLGKNAAALDSYARAIAADLSNPSAFYNLGVTLAALGRLDDAIQSYRRCVALDQGNQTGWINLGNAFRISARIEESLDAYHRAIVFNPGSVDPLGNFGVALQDFGRSDHASLAFLRALAINPVSAEQHCNLGACLAAGGKHAEAATCFRRALALRPDHHKSINNLSVSLRTVHAYEESLCLADRALSVHPANPEVLNNRGTIFRNLQRYAQALTSYDAALAVKPDFSEAMTNRGTALMELRHVDKSIPCFERAHLLEHRNWSALWNAALASLSIGDFEKGWVLHEHRFIAGAVADPRIDPTRLFSPAKRGGSPILVRAEQGLGDELMFGSMIADFHLFAGSLVVQADSRLLPLFRRSFDADIHFIESGDPAGAQLCGTEISAGSVGRYVRNRYDSFANSAVGYLRADPKKVAEIREVIARMSRSLILGVSWRSTNLDSAGQRNIDLSLICEVLEKVLPDAAVISLQYGRVDTEIARSRRVSGVRVIEYPFVDVTQDIDDVAALITACDAVLTIGNTTAHLCGALGKKAAVLLPFAPSWRWMADGPSTPWYASVQLFRKRDQETHWREVIVDATTYLRGVAD